MNLNFIFLSVHGYLKATLCIFLYVSKDLLFAWRNISLQSNARGTADNSNDESLCGGISMNL